MDNRWPLEIDHIDGDRTNNAWANLREVTRSQNSMNARLRNTNTSGVKGVYWHKGANKWMATIKVNEESHYLGLFASLDKANAIRQKAARKFHGKFARYR